MFKKNFGQVAGPFYLDRILSKSMLFYYLCRKIVAQIDCRPDLQGSGGLKQASDLAQFFIVLLSGLYQR